jgi:ribosome-binding factor A
MRSPTSFNRKQAQLCSEVEQVVALVLGSSIDERLQRLYVHSVSIAKDGTCLLISVIPSDPLDVESAAELITALDGAKTWVRQQVAEEINRKRTPELRFQLIFPSTEGEP